ncbi:hypothetical protein [Sphingomonas aerophila]|jgi:murein endopeptidase|uniref:hypothetical protein n=1 Tax=Sphingomonas aerophila TaxID=1344948 RepID=UPI00160C9993|nr:hypothetical protein [Sphingomonas aerophila]
MSLHQTGNQPNGLASERRRGIDRAPSVAAKPRLVARFATLAVLGTMAVPAHGPVAQVVRAHA